MSDARRQTLHEFLRFSIIGTLGVFVDSGALYGAMHGLGLDHYSGRLVSWVVAATFTWAMNRRFTFKDDRPAVVQWAKYLATASIGGVVNYGVYAGLVAFTPVVAAYPFLGVAAGSISGLAFNFTSSKWLVFRTHKNS